MKDIKMGNTVKYVVRWWVCDESSMAGGNWDEENRKFDYEDQALLFAAGLSKRHHPITVTEERLILELG